MNEETVAVEVFRAGDYGPKGQWSEDDLDSIANAYDPTRHEAPVTLDHRQDGPAHGWVRRVARMGDRLVATLGGLSEELRGLLRAGSYRKRSVEIYRAMPPEERPYLKAVSFLGAAAPEVKGMTDPLFAEGESAVERFDECSVPGEGGAEEEAQTVSDNEAARELRERLVHDRCWDPRWDDAGIADVFAALGTAAAREALGALEKVLRLAAKPILFGETPREADSVPAEETRFAENADPASVARHRAAANLQTANPGMSYAEALLRAGR